MLQMHALPSHRASPSSWTVRLAAVLLVFSLGFLVNEYELVRFLSTNSVGATVAVAPLASTAATPTTTAAAPLFDRTAIDAARTAALALRDRLVERAPFRDATSFARTMPIAGAEHVLASKYAHSMTTRQAFVVGVLGSSNAACHDTEVSTCFPTYFAEDLVPLLEPMSVRVELRNHAMGNINSIYTAMCIDTLLGDDVDVAFFEFLMNDAGMVCLPATHEALVRRALQMPKQPTVTFVEIEGGRRADGGPREPVVGELDRHAYGGAHVQLRNYYAEFDVHHMEMLDGLHTVDHIEGWRYEDLFVTFHPGPRGHRYLADQLLYYHVAAFLMALDLLADAPTAYAAPRRRPLPPALYCGEWCGDELPDCYTSFQPLVRTNKTLGHAMHLPHPPPLVETAEEAQRMTMANLPSTVVAWERVLGIHEKLHPERAYVDFKLQWVARRGAGAREFHVRVPCGGVGIVVLCQPPPFWGKVDDNQAPLRSDQVRYAIDGVETTPRRNEEVGGFALCGNHWEENCIALGKNLTADVHVLSVEPLSDNFVLLAHVVGV